MENKNSTISSFFKEKIMFVKTPNPINSQNDVKRAYISIALIITFMIGGLAFAIYTLISDFSPISISNLYFSPGLFCIFLFIKSVAKTVKSATKVGKSVGETMTDEYVTVKHEFNDTYKVTKTTTDKGLEVGCLGFFVGILAWGIIFIYCGTPLMIIRLINTFKAIKAFNSL